jgi:cation transport regulator ChaB
MGVQQQHQMLLGHIIRQVDKADKVDTDEQEAVAVVVALQAVKMAVVVALYVHV